MRGLYFATLMFTALSMSMPFCHLLEMPARLSWDAPLWIETTVTGAVFYMFGRVGWIFEIAAIVSSLALLVHLRRQRAATDLVVGGALMLVVGHAVFWIVTAPVNAEIASWTPSTFPQDWQAWRMQWEYSHATRAVLQIAALGALLWSAMREVPGPRRFNRWATQPHATAMR
jgi:hypothetical protein